MKKFFKRSITGPSLRDAMDRTLSEVYGIPKHNPLIDALQDPQVKKAVVNIILEAAQTDMTVRSALELGQRSSMIRP
jgi:hypothetical protein